VHRILTRYFAVQRQALLWRRQTEHGQSLAQAPELPDRRRAITDRRTLAHQSASHLLVRRVGA
jgi:hypothetical protein